MKKLLIISFFFALLGAGCKKSFLDVPNTTGITLGELKNKAGVQQLLVAAYHDVTGLTAKSSWWSTTGTNWIYGDVTSGDAYRGGTNDGSDGLTIEHFLTQSSTAHLADKWRTVYDGVSRCNKVIRAANAAIDMTADEKTKAIAEARFLRGHFHFEAKKMWNNVPFIDEVTDSIYEVSKQFTVSNDIDIWPNIEADFQFAYDNMPAVQKYKGQANKWAAACYLAKALMFEKKFTEAKTLLNTIIPAAYGGNGNGVNAQGQSYALMANFDDNFNPELENSPEHIFQIEFSANDGSNSGNSNIGESGNTPTFYPLTSFYVSWKQPTFNLVNAFKTDANGLPMLDDFNDDNMTNDEDYKGYDYYNTYQGTVDPRLDWTVGRRGVPYLDWTTPSYYSGYGSNPGSDPDYGWITDRTFGGPYIPIKNNFRYANGDFAKYSENYAQYYLLTSAVNVSIIRFADVLLWAAECEVEVGTLDRARKLVNYVRERAKDGRQVEVVYDDIGGYVASANYYVDLYNTPWTGQDEARKAVRFERRLELALEGHRFFDLVRWGVAADYINKYLQEEKPRLPNVLNGVTFTASKNEYFPIPQIEIDLNSTIKQNPGY
ncbi:MAG TPA: RagB/SusD family nutrient uptake outer membrane protein [Chitinophagaceae bacterium]|nr:RagB/SusD family nutrient uptake outer membrane protein [Chitinophagaceae bacterium]